MGVNRQSSPRVRARPLSTQNGGLPMHRPTVSRNGPSISNRDPMRASCDRGWAPTAVQNLEMSNPDGVFAPALQTRHTV